MKHGQTTKKKTSYRYTVDVKRIGVSLKIFYCGGCIKNVTISISRAETNQFRNKNK